MIGIRKSAFNTQDDAIRHMLDLFAAEARNLGHHLTDSELDLLARECPLPADLEYDAKEIITQLLAKEALQAEADSREDPKSFGNTLDWANEPKYPNIARLTEEAISGSTREPRLRGWRCVADGLLLVLSAIGVIIFLMVISYFLSK